MAWTRRPLAPCHWVMVIWEGIRTELPIRMIAVPARLHPGEYSRHGQAFTAQQVVYAPGFPAEQVTSAARACGLSPALSWLASNSPTLAGRHA